jgi:hypothetical protein
MRNQPGLLVKKSGPGIALLRSCTRKAICSNTMTDKDKTQIRDEGTGPVLAD